MTCSLVKQPFENYVALQTVLSVWSKEQSIFSGISQNSSKSPLQNYSINSHPFPSPYVKFCSNSSVTSYQPVSFNKAYENLVYTESPVN